MAKNKLISPFLKWVGGKRQLIADLTKVLPLNVNKLEYFEPFIGGGALFFNLQPKSASINDANTELINTYLVIKNQLDELLVALKKHENNSEYFYKIRGLDRESAFSKLSDVEKAARIIYLNKTCFNGLYRVNASGEFNSPFGSYSNPNIVNEPVLKAVSSYLNSANVKITNLDYEKALSGVSKNSFVYFDPPYHPVSNTSNFTGYIAGGWGEDEQTRLRDLCRVLDANGVKFLLSNSNANLIKSLYKDFRIVTVKATRSINSVGAKRGEVDELLIKNYE